jgi:hypothetical protein
MQEISEVLKPLLIPAFFERKWAAGAVFSAQIVYACELWLGAERHIISFMLRVSHA